VKVAGEALATRRQRLAHASKTDDPTTIREPAVDPAPTGIAEHSEAPAPEPAAVGAGPAQVSRPPDSILGPSVSRPVIRPVAPAFRSAPPPPGRAVRDPERPPPAFQPVRAADGMEWVPPRPEPARARRTPGQATVRLHALVGVIVGLLLVAALGVLWLYEVHPRIGQLSLERGIATRIGAKGVSVRCVASKANGAVWTCAAVYDAESVCELASVSVLGDWNLVAANSKRCLAIPSLAALAPKITASGVRLAYAHDFGDSLTTCAAVPDHTNRWLCLGRGRNGPTCTSIRAVAWTPFASTAEALSVCERIPQLRHALAGA